MSDRKIPNPVIALAADVLGGQGYNHTRLNTVFAEAGVPGDPPAGNCVQKCDQWLAVCNADPAVDAFGVLGRVVENFMERDRNQSLWEQSPPEEDSGNKRIRDTLARYGLSYAPGDVIFGAGSSPASESLQAVLRAKALPGLRRSFSARSPRLRRIRLLVLQHLFPAGRALTIIPT